MLFLDADINTDGETNLDEMDQDEDNELEKRWNLNYFKDCRFFEQFGPILLALFCIILSV